METKEFLDRLDEPALVEAIAEAERKTSGQIRVFVSSHAVEDAMAEAGRQFAKLGMEKTRERNGVLLYFAPRSQKFAVFGDEAIHRKCGTPFWEEVVGDLRGHLREERFTDAAVHGIRKVGELLARHFPPGSGAGDELTNEIARD